MAIGEYITFETVSLLIAIIVPLWGAAFGLGVLYTRLNHQREELTRIKDDELAKLKERVNDLNVKLSAYLLAAEELKELKQSGSDSQQP